VLVAHRFRKWNGDLRAINMVAQLSDKGLVDI
jgi:hypothetical protein